MRAFLRHLTRPVLLALALCGAASALTVADFRLPAPDPARPAGQTRLLAHLRAELGLPVCAGGEVRQQLSGALTRAAPQTAYLLYNCAAAALDPQRREFGRLVLERSGRLVASWRNVGDEVRLLPDLNGDGLNELLFVTAVGPQMGEFSENVSVVSLAGGRLTRLLDLSSAYHSSCGVPGAGGVSAWRIEAQPGRAGARPRFGLTRYRAACPAAGQDPSPQDYRPAPARP